MRSMDSDSRAIDIRTYRRVIAQLLPSGHPTIDQVADQLGLSRRTLQRRLLTKGLTYTDLVEQQHCGLACRYLKSQKLRIAEVAKVLGYNDPAHFSRVFKRWKKMSPLKYRESVKH